MELALQRKERSEQGKVLSVRQEPRNRMLVGEAEELIGMRPWRAQCALVRGLYISGNEDL